MNDAEYFTVLDARDAFYSIQLDDESSLLTTFGTPYGRFRYLRMPMGISSASEVYQQTIEQLLMGYPCIPIMDDILVHGKTEQEHDQNVKQVLQRLQDIGIRLGKQKCQFRVNSVKYIGHEITDQGF